MAPARATTRPATASRPDDASPRATTTSACAVTTAVDVAADAWFAPVETISNSENGFERVYQGSGLLLSWPLHLGAGRDHAPERPPRRHDRPRPDRRGPVSRPRLVVHGHFYQPPRLDPTTGSTPIDPTAAPARDWNERIAPTATGPNAMAGNLAAMSWDLGPTLAGWLETGDPVAYDGFVAGERGANGMAQPFHHAILPLASAADRRTEIRWGLRDFELRFGRRPAGMWLPETAVDLATLRAMADEGITYTVLAPWQVDGIVDTRRPHRIDLGTGGRWSSCSTTACCRPPSRSSRGRPSTPTPSSATALVPRFPAEATATGHRSS